MQFIFIFNLATYKPLTYGQYVYPAWGQAIGWLLTASSLTCIPAVMIYKLIKTTGTIREVHDSLIIASYPDIVLQCAHRRRKWAQKGKHTKSTFL